MAGTSKSILEYVQLPHSNKKKGSCSNIEEAKEEVERNNDCGPGETKRYNFSYFDEIPYEPDTTGISPFSRVLIYRDYSEGIMKFCEKIPPILKDNMHVEENVWKTTIGEINKICHDAEKLGWPNVRENLTYCLTCYLITFCRPSIYKRCMDRLSLYVKEQNRKVYERLGLRITDPAISGYRYIEVVIKYLEWRTTMPILHWGNPSLGQYHPTELTIRQYELAENT